MQDTQETTIQEFDSKDNSRYERYSEYEAPSGDNLQKVPVHWESRSFQYWAEKKNDKGNEEERDFITLEHINPVTGNLVDNFEWEQKKSQEYYLFEPGDVLFGKLRPYLRKYYQVDKKGCCGTDLMVLSPNSDVQSRYLYYFLHSEDFIQFTDANSHGVKMPRTSWTKVSSAHFQLPPIEEQNAIVEFLDWETSRIDQLIGEKEKLIKLLDEKRNAIINKLVTSGINDSRHKDIELEWFDSIPDDWETTSLRNTVDKFVDYRGATPEKSDSGITLITAKNIDNGKLDFSEDHEYISEDEYNEWMTRGDPEEGDVLITTEAPMGEVAQIQETPVALAQRIILLKVNTDLLKKDFLKYYLDSEFNQTQLIKNQTGSTAKGIQASKLKGIRVMVPPISEQEDILGTIREETQKIDDLISQVEEGIDRLKEYRTALITNAVTGQIDVRGEV
ncbi:restriction endonuclease subunit S [Halorientalis brevis]|uniref:Restriction endonuclease subunit S n=1 Tax=Halorientalis brevis TaxID=1126241 RepID=A0ABD6CG38_9EURY|nr:restriction endonuclease subunit S [Halorientalis brevis]